MQVGGSQDPPLPEKHAAQPALPATSLTRHQHQQQPHHHDSLVSGLAVAAAVALILAAAATSNSDCLDSALMASASCEVVSNVALGSGSWAASLVEGGDMEDRNASTLLLGGQEIASLASLMKAYALLSMEREEAARTPSPKTVEVES